MKKLSVETGKLLTQYMSAHVAVRNKTKLAVDGLIADGIVPDDLLSPKGDGDRTVYDSLLGFIQAGMSKNEQALLNASPRDLPEASKAHRNDALRRRSSALKDLRSALKRRLTNADRGAQPKWTLTDRIIKRTNEIREIIQKAEAPTFDTTKVLGKLIELEKLIK
jgi:hypothetical protein